MRGIWRRVGDTAVPISPRARAFLEKVKENGVFSDEKNQKQFNLFWALCGLVAENLGTTKEAVKNSVMYKAGYIKDLWTDVWGKTHIEIKSLGEMKQKEFDMLFKDSIPIMAE